MSADHLAVDAIVTRILIGFEQGRGRGDDESDVLAAEYVAAVRGLPLAAIHAAAERFRSGETLKPWNRRFRPSPPEFATEAREGLIPVRTTLLHARRVLDAEVYDPPAVSAEERRAALESAAAKPNSLLAAGRSAAAPRPDAVEVTAAREAGLREMGAAAARACDADTLARLNARLDVRRGGRSA